MKYNVITIGKPKESGLRDALSFYQERLGKLASVEVTHLSEIKNGKAHDKQERESETLFKAAHGLVVLLDERGKTYGSRALADKMEQLDVMGDSAVSFLIGGADGHTPELRDKADLVLSLSSLTFSHELALVVLMEQLYRVEAIRAGHPYHRD